MILPFSTKEIPSAAVYITVIPDTGTAFTAIRCNSDDSWRDPETRQGVNVDNIRGVAYVTNDAVDRSGTIPQH